jgi:DNA-binding MarR family transcriptional regulator
MFDSPEATTYSLSMPTPPIADTYFSIPELMRVARGSYKRAIDIRLAAGGFDDLPTASGFLLAYLTNDEESIPERIEGLGIKQREFRQLVDTLVLRGYITREIDPADGRVSLALTERGRAANDASFEGATYVDEELQRRLSEAEIAGLRHGLAVLGEIKQSLTGPVIRRGLPH